MTAECNYIVTDKDGKQLGRVMKPLDKANLRDAFTQLVEVYNLVYHTNGWYRLEEDSSGCDGSDEEIPTHSNDTICDHCSLLIPSDDRWRQVASRLEDMLVAVKGEGHLINLIEELLKEEEK